MRARSGIITNYSVEVPLQQVSREELRYILRKVSNLLEQLQDVYLYGQLNQHGFTRIICKTNNYCGSRSDVSCVLKLTECRFWDQIDCLNEINGVGDFAAVLRSACAEGAPGSATLSLRLSTFSMRTPSFSNSLNDSCQAICEDNLPFLQQILQEQETKSLRKNEEQQPLLYELLEFSTICLSKRCVKSLARFVRSAAPTHHTDTGNIFHRLTEDIGLQCKYTRVTDTHPIKSTQLVKRNVVCEQLWSDAVDALAERARPALEERDCFGRTPLHYACRYGLVGLCRVYLECLMPDREVSYVDLCHFLFSKDIDGFTPFQLSVLSGHLENIRNTVEFIKHKTIDDHTYRKMDIAIGQAIHLALRCLIEPGRSQLARYLISTLKNLDVSTSMGRTTVYVAAQSGSDLVLKDVLTRFPHHGKLLNTPEPLQGWTPLIVACVEGHFNTAKVIVESGAANPAIRDLSGWTAKEHAAFRGHLDIAKWLAYLSENGQRSIPLRTLRSPRRRSPVTAETAHILLTIGPSNTRSGLQAVDINHMSIPHKWSLSNGANYALQISAISAIGPKLSIRLPILEDTINDPWCFTTDNPEKVKFILSIVRVNKHEDDSNVLVASGVAVLKDLKQGFSPKHESLDRDYTIPLLHKGTLEWAGTVTFSFLTITPLPFQSVPLEAKQGFWKSNASTKVVGHRGRSVYNS